VTYIDDDVVSPVDRDHFDYSPWGFWRQADPAQQQRQLEIQASLGKRFGFVFGERCFVSELAAVQTDTLELGAESYVAGHAYISGDVRTGRHCTINTFAVVRGTIRLGDAVRIGAHTSILAFNHTMTDPDVEVFRQPISSRGISVGDDVWIGSHAVLLDGVSVGDRSVVAAGSVVTKDVPAGAVVGGNPARVLRWRVAPADPDADPSAGSAARSSGPGAGSGVAGAGAAGATDATDAAGALAERLSAFVGRARGQAADVLARSWVDDPDGGRFVDRPGTPATVRAQCDAIEIADLLLGTAPPQRPHEEQVAWLRGRQDRRTGLVPRLGPDGRSAPTAPAPGLDDGDVAYHVLCVGYALDVLGSAFPYPIEVVAAATPERLLADLAAQPWEGRAWGAGAWVDTIGTALTWNHRQGVAGGTGAAEAVVGWLVTRADPDTGLWGSPQRNDGLLQVVNGFYRASRGTLAQFGLPLPYPERVVDTVLRHAADPAFFSRERQNACNVLDVAHPLWLAGRQTAHRRAEVVALAGRLLADAVGHWVDGQGFGFRASWPTTRSLPSAAPGLQGTEMWLAIVWLLADLAGLADVLGYRPRGIHRPEPAVRLAPRW
jgi:acetyltransferase-like isoleucine patch superfamily enzyme